MSAIPTNTLSSAAEEEDLSALVEAEELDLEALEAEEELDACAEEEELDAQTSPMPCRPEKRRVKIVLDLPPSWQAGLRSLLGWWGQKKLQHRKRLRVCESVSLGEKRFVAVVEVGDEQYLVGGSSHSICMLAPLGVALDAPRDTLSLRSVLR